MTDTVQAVDTAKKDKAPKVDILAQVLGKENLTLDTRLDDLLKNVESAKLLMEQRNTIERKFNELGVPAVLLPTSKPPTFNPQLSALSDDELGNLFGVYTAWVAYLKNYVSLKEMDILYANQAYTKTMQLLTRKYRGSGASASIAGDLVAMDYAVLGLTDLVMEFKMEKALAESRLSPFQDYAKALSREITRRTPDMHRSQGTQSFEGAAQADGRLQEIPGAPDPASARAS